MRNLDRFLGPGPRIRSPDCLHPADRVMRHISVTRLPVEDDRLGDPTSSRTPCDLEFCWLQTERRRSAVVVPVR
jgi:hypothetical protein